MANGLDLLHRSPAQQCALRHLRQDATLTPAERHRVAVILCSHQGEMLRELAADLGYRYDTVRLWLQAWTTRGVDFVRHRPTGPPPDQTRRQQVTTALAQLLQVPDRTWTSAQLAQGLADVHDIQLSAPQCRKYLQAMGAIWRRTQASRQRRQDPQQVAQARAELQALKKVPGGGSPALLPGRRRLCLDLAQDHHSRLARARRQGLQQKGLQVLTL